MCFICHSNKFRVKNFIANISNVFILEVYFSHTDKYLENSRIKRKKENRINTAGSGDPSVPTTPRAILTLFSRADDSCRHGQIRAVFQAVSEGMLLNGC